MKIETHTYKIFPSQPQVNDGKPGTMVGTDRNGIQSHSDRQLVGIDFQGQAEPITGEGLVSHDLKGDGFLKGSEFKSADLGISSGASTTKRRSSLLEGEP